MSETNLIWSIDQLKKVSALPLFVSLFVTEMIMAADQELDFLITESCCIPIHLMIHVSLEQTLKMISSPYS